MTEVDMKIEDPTYAELTKAVQAQLLRCMAHKDMPMQKLIETLNPTRVGNYSPFFQCMFVMHQRVEDFLQTAYLLAS
jgi:nonribosomal peptide synthetase DhbF